LNVWNGVVLEKTRRFIWMWRQNAPNSKSALNHLFFFNCIPANSNPVPIFGRVFHFGPWPLNYAIEPLIDQ
jgi:hypothetical protein